MANKWLAHVKKTMKVMKRKGTYKKGLGLSQVIKEAKKHWHKKGGADGTDSKSDESSDAPSPSEDTEDVDKADTEGGRRRRSRRATKKLKRRGRK